MALEGLHRFSELQRALPGSTARAVTLTLEELQAAQLVLHSERRYQRTALGDEAANRAAALIQALESAAVNASGVNAAQ